MTYARIKTDFGQLIKCTCRQFGQKFSRPPLSPLKSKPQTYAIFHFPYPRIRGPDRVTRGMSYWNYISHTSPKSKSPPTSPFANLAHNRILAALYSHQGRGRERGGVESTRLWRSPGARQGKARQGYYSHYHYSLLHTLHSSKPSDFYSFVWELQSSFHDLNWLENDGKVPKIINFNLFLIISIT